MPNDPARRCDSTASENFRGLAPKNGAEAAAAMVSHTETWQVYFVKPLPALNARRKPLNHAEMAKKLLASFE
jgi:hypothetical protein